MKIHVTLFSSGQVWSAYNNPKDVVRAVGDEVGIKVITININKNKAISFEEFRENNNLKKMSYAERVLTQLTDQNKEELKKLLESN